MPHADADREGERTSGESHPRRAALGLRRPALACALAGVSVLALSACEVTTGPGLFHDGFRGDFDGTFTLEWEPVGFGRGGWIDGHGSIRIHRHRGSRFDGDWVWHLDGHRLRGDLERGRAEFRDEVSFRLETRFGRDVLEEVTGCFFLRGERRFHGFTGHRRLRVSRTARLRCHDAFGFEDDLVVRLTFEGWR